MNSQLQIRTPEGIDFSYSLAGPVTRCMAAAIDMLCALVFSIVVGRLVGMVALIDEDVTRGLMKVGYFVVSVGYGVTLEWAFRGQTIGKRVLRLRVIDANGLRLQFHQVLMRNLLRFVDLLPGFYLLGGVVSLLSPRAQRLGDLAAGTVVIHQLKRTEPDLDQLLAGKFNSLREHPHLAARLRQRVSAEQARVVLQALVRREEFEPAARVALFGELAAHFKTLVPFPVETVESMPDEQYVRNVADLLFRSRSPLERRAESGANSF